MVHTKGGLKYIQAFIDIVTGDIALYEKKNSSYFSHEASSGLMDGK